MFHHSPSKTPRFPEPPKTIGTRSWLLASVLACFFPGSYALAATVTWDGAAGTTWSTAGSWVPNAPTSSDSLQLANATTGNVLILDSGTQTIDQFLYRASGNTLFAVRTQTNSLVINSGLSVPTGVTGGYLSMFGNVVVDGNQTWATPNAGATLTLGERTDALGNRVGAGTITLNGNLQWSGSSTLSLQATTLTGSGNIVMNAGSLRYSGGAGTNLNIQGTGMTILNNASNLIFQTASGNLNTITRAIQMNGTSRITHENSSNKDSTIAAPIEFNGTHTVTFGGSTWNFSGVWSGTGNVQLATGGAVSFTLSGANTFSGAMRLTSGTTRFSNVLGLENATLDLATGDTGIVSLVTAGTYTIGGLTGSRGFGLGTRTVRIGNNNASTVYSGELSNGSLVKVGSGTFTLSGANTYEGSTDVQAGVLNVGGSLANSSLTVASGATLMGSGTIAGLTTISGTHMPGNSPGIQTFANLTYNAGASVQWELWGNTTVNSPLAFDQVVVSGNLAFNGATTLGLVFTGSAGPSDFSTVTWSDPFWDSGREWLLYDVSGTTTGFSENLLLNGANWQDSTGAFFQTARQGSSFTVEQRGQDVYMVYATAVPEPAGLVLVSTGVAAVGWYVTRRRQTTRRC